MEDQVYDLSLTWEGEAVPDGWVYDQKGWTVFLQEGETVTELAPDGFGGFSGPVEPGQTFCFSRVMDEELDAPTLRLGRANRTFAVFLDGDLLYTDCPELTGGIGALRLPVLEWYEEEPLLESPLFGLENVVLTPHIGGLADKQIHDVAVLSAENCAAVLSGHTDNLNMICR